MKVRSALAIVLAIDVLAIGIVPVLFSAHLLFPQVLPSFGLQDQRGLEALFRLYMWLFPLEFLGPFIFFPLLVAPLVTIVLFASALGILRNRPTSRNLLLLTMATYGTLEVLALGLNTLNSYSTDLFWGDGSFINLPRDAFLIVSRVWVVFVVVLLHALYLPKRPNVTAQVPAV